MDIRNPLKPIDQKIIQKTSFLNTPTLILLNKSDKINKQILYTTIQKTKKKIHATFTQKNIQIKEFSSVKKQNIETLEQILNCWLT